MTEKLGSADFEKNELKKTVKELETRCKSLQEAQEKTTEVRHFMLTYTFIASCR